MSASTFSTVQNTKRHSTRKSTDKTTSIDNGHYSGNYMLILFEGNKNIGEPMGLKLYLWFRVSLITFSTWKVIYYPAVIKTQRREMRYSMVKFPVA